MVSYMMKPSYRPPVTPYFTSTLLTIFRLLRFERFTDIVFPFL